MNLHEECLLKYLLHPLDLLQSTELLKINNSIIEKGLVGDKFLSKKVKRQTDDEYLKEKQIPERIKDLMSKYGDVLATISKNDIDKYKKYRIYSEITN